MGFILRLALVAAAVVAARSARGDETAALVGAGAAAILFGPSLLRGLGPRRRPSRPESAAAEPVAGGGGRAPSRADYLDAGVDTRTCGRCRRPIRTAAYLFCLDEKPTVYCEACWNLAAPADDPVRRAQWLRRLPDGFERRPA